MAPLRPALAQSESKARFFERLGLQESNEYHRRVYGMMKEEAVQGRQRISASQDVLVPALRSNPNIEPPYSNAQINETVIHREILRIYEHASPETRVLYNLGRDTDRVEEENWVIRWMLWHVFRYRDNRNRNRRTQSPSPTRTAATSASAATLVMATQPTTAGEFSSDPTHWPDGWLTCSAATTAFTPAPYYWDPVRNQWYMR